MPSNGPLTETETEILRHLAAGLSTPQIARLMQRSLHTVRTHVRNAAEKLETRGGKLGLLARARQLGLLEDRL